MSQFVVKIRHHNDTCFNEIGLCANQNILVILRFYSNTSGSAYVIT